jgi:hypothetical protein
MPGRIFFVMGRVLAILVFALAAGSATLAATGFAVAPHVDPPGMPRVHDHILATYRYALYLLRLERPVLAGAHFDATAAAGAAIDVLVLAVLATLVPRLPRPTRRPLARLAPVSVGAPQWRTAPALGPPRASTLLPA